MYWPLVAIALAVPPPAAPRVEARATVRVLTSVRMSKETWDASPNRTERLVREQDGRWVLLRTVDFQ